MIWSISSVFKMPNTVAVVFNLLIFNRGSEQGDDGKSEEDIQLVSRASALHIDQMSTASLTSDLKCHTPVASKMDFWDSDENAEAMKNVKLPLNISHEEMRDMASMLPACHVFDIDLTPFTIKTGKVSAS